MMPIEERAGSILVVDAQFDPTLRWLLNYETLGFIEVLTRVGRRYQGGLWVGGRLRLYEDRLDFEPSRIDREFGDKLDSISVQLAFVTNLTHRDNALGGTIVLDHNNTCLKLRCWKARTFFGAIKSATAHARKESIPAIGTLVAME